MSSPSRRTSPASCADGTASCMRLRMRRNVDLPQPDGPINAVTVARGIDRFTRSRTWVVPNQADTSTASGWPPPATPAGDRRADDGRVLFRSRDGPVEPARLTRIIDRQRHLVTCTVTVFEV